MGVFEDEVRKLVKEEVGREVGVQMERTARALQREMKSVAKSCINESYIPKRAYFAWDGNEDSSLLSAVRVAVNWAALNSERSEGAVWTRLKKILAEDAERG